MSSFVGILIKSLILLLGIHNTIAKLMMFTSATIRFQLVGFICMWDLFVCGIYLFVGFICLWDLFVCGIYLFVGLLYLWDLFVPLTDFLSELHIGSMYLYYSRQP